MLLEDTALPLPYSGFCLMFYVKMWTNLAIKWPPTIKHRGVYFHNIWSIFWSYFYIFRVFAVSFRQISVNFVFLLVWYYFVHSVRDGRQYLGEGGTKKEKSYIKGDHTPLPTLTATPTCLYLWIYTRKKQGKIKKERLWRWYVCLFSSSFFTSFVKDYCTVYISCEIWRE